MVLHHPDMHKGTNITYPLLAFVPWQKDIALLYLFALNTLKKDQLPEFDNYCYSGYLIIFISNHQVFHEFNSLAQIS